MAECILPFKFPKFAVTDSEKVVEDRLTSLPNSLILHILSFLPTEEAVKTMLVSKSISSLWTLLPSIHLHCNDYRYWEGNCINYSSRFCEFLRYVLKHHKRPKIDRFKVYISSRFIGPNIKNDLQSCIDFALHKQVKTLHFSYYEIALHSMLFKWPSELISDSLVELRLGFVDLNSLTQVHLGSLRLLRLNKVDVSESVLGEIICGCPLLKELELLNCSDLYELSFAAPNVEKLKVNIFELFYSNEEHFVKINCPNLKSLEFIGHGCCVEIVNLSSVVNVTFDLHCGFLDYIEIPKIISVLKTLLCAKNVSFSDDLVMTSFFYLLKQASHVPTINWKSARFSFWLTKKYIHDLDCMLRNSPHLEELVIYFQRRRKDISELIEVQFEDGVLDNEDCWMCLQSVILHKIENTSYPVLVSFIELLLKKAPKLNQLMFYYEQRLCFNTFDEFYLTNEEMTKFEEKTSKFSKAFPNVKISCTSTKCIVF